MPNLGRERISLTSKGTKNIPKKSNISYRLLNGNLITRSRGI
jgi:hypothetical protein